MATATVGLTYTNPNFVGPLFHLTPNDTPLLSAIGGLNGGVSVTSKYHTWQTDDNAAASQPSIVEGADPAYAERTRSEVSNILQIFQLGVEVTYTKMAATGQLGDYASNRAWSVMGDQPVQDERARQLMLKLALIKRQVEYSMLRGTYQAPADNTTGRQMRGLKAAITTNTLDKFSALTDTTATFDVTGGALEDLWTATAHGLSVGDEIQFTAVGTGAEPYAVDTPYWVVTVNDANTFQLSATKGGAVLAGTGSDSSGTWTAKKATDVTKADLDRLLREMVEGTTSAAPLANPVWMMGAYNKQRISDIYGYAPESRSIGGLNIQQIQMDFGPELIGIVFNRHMHPGDIYLLDLSVIKPVFMSIPGKGHFFAEKLAQTGAAEHWQLYGEIGLEYGPETFHGKITGATTA